MFNPCAMDLGRLCEPVDIDPSIALRVSHVCEGPASPVPERFRHFHDACELLWFSSVEGKLFSEAGEIALKSGMALYLPAMHVHDFDITAGAKEWILVHLDPIVAAQLVREDGMGSPRDAICAKFEGSEQLQIDSAFRMLARHPGKDDAGRKNRHRLVRFLLSEVWRNGTEARSESTETDPSGFERLRPAIDLVARAVYSDLTLEAAASACNLSPAYFSRRFKAAFGQNFSDYVRAYRLRFAARRLLTTKEQIAQIAYGTGFQNAAHFSVLFKRHFGVSPGTYRSAAKAKDSAY